MKIKYSRKTWGFSSAGRAPALHAGGQEFESPNLHHLKQIELLKSEPSGSFLVFRVSGILRKSIASLTCKSESF